jgi:uncharacterized RDD family membrane protein YckC
MGIGKPVFAILIVFATLITILYIFVGADVAKSTLLWTGVGYIFAVIAAGFYYFNFYEYKKYET